MPDVIAGFDKAMKKSSIPDVRSGDTVRVQQKIREGKKERIQAFEGTVIRVRRMGSHTANITVRRISSEVGVEKTYFLHSPNVKKVEIIKRGKVRRNFLSYLRQRQGKSTRLADKQFDREAANIQGEEPAEAASKDLGVQAELEPKAEKNQPKAEQKPEKPASEQQKSSNQTKDITDKSKAQATTEQPKDSGDEPSQEQADNNSKAQQKKAKAEAFRKAQEAKKN